MESEKRIEREDGGEQTTDWEALLAGGADEGPPWIRLTLERVAHLSLEDCLMQLELAADDVDRLGFAAKSAHLALQAALTAALAGTANIGAHETKLRLAHLAHLEGRGDGPARPASDRVMAFPDLLDAAAQHPLPWTHEPLPVTDEQRELLARLTEVRHAVEHPKQRIHSIGPRYVVEALPVAAELAETLLGTVAHHLARGDLARIAQTVARIRKLCAEVQAWQEG